MWKCDYCGTRNKDEREDCRNCGAPNQDDAPAPAMPYEPSALYLQPTAFTCATYQTISNGGALQIANGATGVNWAAQ